jgi:hypothetical protein
MKPHVLCALVPLLASAAGCATLGGDEPLVVTAGTFPIAVDARAYVNHPSVKITQGQTEIVWTASGGSIESLWIAFKPDAGRQPPDPDCLDRTCTLPAQSSAGKSGEFEYLVGVKMTNGNWKIRDPRLIIIP